MMTDPRKLKQTQLCELLNSTPLGEVITTAKFRKHRTQAGLRIKHGSQHYDLLAYTAWLVEQRHASPTVSESGDNATESLTQAAEGAAGIVASWSQMRGHGQKLTHKQEKVIAALLTEPSHSQAAKAAGIGEATLYRWMQIPSFREAYRQARQELVEAAIGRIQAASGEAVEALLKITRTAKRDSDRVRAATALLDYAFRGLAEADLLHPQVDVLEMSEMRTEDIVQLLANRLRQLDQSELSTAEKTRLTSTLSQSLLRAITVDVLDKRLEALSQVLLEREEKKP